MEPRDLLAIENMSLSLALGLVLGLGLGLGLGLFVGQALGLITVLGLVLVLGPGTVLISLLLMLLGARLEVRMGLVPGLLLGALLSLVRIFFGPGTDLPLNSSSPFLFRCHPDLAVEFEERIFRARKEREGLSLKLEIFFLRFDIFKTVVKLEVQKALSKLDVSS
jgi:hypothetical protein